MELYVQMGHGMEKMCGDLLKAWGGGTIVFSPVNTKRNKLKSLAETYQLYNGKVLFDPQLYYPHDGAENLKEYDYWPSENSTMSDSNEQTKVLKSILRINEEMGTEQIILPGREMDTRRFETDVEGMKKYSDFFRNHTSKPLLATLCLFTETLRSSQEIEFLYEIIRGLDVDGFYIVLRASNDDYIVSDAIWMIGFMKLMACLKLLRKKVIVGYTNHQSIVAALAHVDAICSGNYMNTRRFEPKRFQSKKGDVDLRKSLWYFHPYALTEYKAALLDIAYNRGYLDTFKPVGEFKNSYSDMLFSGALPSSTGYSEPNSFKHYLHCMRVLCDGVSLDTFEGTYDKFSFLINTSERLIRDYRSKGLQSQNRDFGIGIESLRIAANTVCEDYGFKLRLDWDRL